MTLNAHHQALLEARGLDVELAERFGWSSSTKGRDWIEIPYIQDGRRVNTKFRTLGATKRFSQDPNGTKTYWNVDILADETLKNQPLIVTEGEMDALVAIQCGFVRAVSVPDGAPPEAVGAYDAGAKYSYVRDTKARLAGCKEIILAVDGDRTGVNLLNDLALRFGKARCKWLEYPEGCKDLNDILMKYGPSTVVEVIQRAKWIRVEGLFRMSEMPPINPAVPYSTGIAGMDKHWKIRLGDFTVLSGVPGHGKSSFANEVMSRMADAYGWRTAVAAFETNPQIDHRRMLRTFYNRKPAKFQDAAEIDAADQWIDEHFLFCMPNEDEDCTLAWLLEKAEACAAQYGAQMLIVDPFNEMDHDRPQDMSLVEYTGFAIKQFKKLARRMNMHVLVVAHPTKLARDKEGKTPIPSLYDIADAAHWANKPDAGIIIHRTDQTRTLIRIQKTRYHDEIGEPGDLQAMFLRDQARFEIIDPAALI